MRRMAPAANSAYFNTSASRLVVPKELATVATKRFRCKFFRRVGSPGLEVDSRRSWSPEGGEDRTGGVAIPGIASYSIGDVRKVEDGL